MLDFIQGAVLQSNRTHACIVKCLEKINKSKSVPG